MDKGKWIYTIASIFLGILMLLPAHTNLFALTVKGLVDVNWFEILPDIVSLLILLVTYLILKTVYTKHSMYIKVYPVYVFIIIALWTIQI